MIIADFYYQKLKVNMFRLFFLSPQYYNSFKLANNLFYTFYKYIRITANFYY